MNRPQPSNNAMDMVTLGERGQIVIPAAIRERMGLRAGDKLMVFTKHGEMICIVPTSSMRHLVDVLNAQLSEIDGQSDPKLKQENN
ncbi:MAG TPA: AbrB/MazE/SpoVT family DNA-binding domain-containing protein [Candidatus Saccharimonadia bacterium]